METHFSLHDYFTTDIYRPGGEMYCDDEAERPLK
ncbi:hypothetical protein A2U01_0083101, partial [Trifolium medium]|nr:hypothetical protein [Trifolium medium]